MAKIPRVNAPSNDPLILDVCKSMSEESSMIGVPNSERLKIIKVEITPHTNAKTPNELVLRRRMHEKRITKFIVVETIWSTATSETLFWEANFFTSSDIADHFQ